MIQNLRTIEPPHLVGLNSINTPGGARPNNRAPDEPLEFHIPIRIEFHIPDPYRW